MTEKKINDVCIIGAGPAGSICGFRGFTLEKKIQKK